MLRLLIKQSIRECYSIKRTQFCFMNMSQSPRTTLNRFTFSTKPSNQQATQQQLTEQELKGNATKFYNNFVSEIIQLRESADWFAVVPNIIAPIVIYFHADWCEHCKKVTPMLEEHVKKANGQYKLLKIDIDKCGELAGEFQVKALPSLYLFVNGQPIDTLVGIPSESDLERFLQTIDNVLLFEKKNEKTIAVLEEARKLVRQKQYQLAEEKLMNLTGSQLDSFVPLRDIFLSQVYFAQKKIAKFKEVMTKIVANEEYYLGFSDLVQYYGLQKQRFQEMAERVNDNEIISSLKAKKLAEPKSLSVRFELAIVYKQHQMLTESLEEAIEIIKQDKNWQNKKANQLILDTFKELGNASPITQKYRKLFQRALN